MFKNMLNVLCKRGKISTIHNLNFISTKICRKKLDKGYMNKTHYRGGGSRFKEIIFC